jgi:hypothetical protein
LSEGFEDCSYEDLAVEFGECDEGVEFLFYTSSWDCYNTCKIRFAFRSTGEKKIKEKKENKYVPPHLKPLHKYS